MSSTANPQTLHDVPEVGLLSWCTFGALAARVLGDSDNAVAAASATATATAAGVPSSDDGNAALTELQKHVIDLVFADADRHLAVTQRALAALTAIQHHEHHHHHHQQEQQQQQQPPQLQSSATTAGATQAERALRSELSAAAGARACVRSRRAADDAPQTACCWRCSFSALSPIGRRFELRRVVVVVVVGNRFDCWLILASRLFVAATFGVAARVDEHRCAVLWRRGRSSMTSRGVDVASL